MRSLTSLSFLSLVTVAATGLMLTAGAAEAQSRWSWWNFWGWFGGWSGGWSGGGSSTVHAVPEIDAGTGLAALAAVLAALAFVWERRRRT